MSGDKSEECFADVGLYVTMKRYLWPYIQFTYANYANYSNYSKIG